MDPNACYKRLVDALADGDVREASDAADDLYDWLRKDGFVPDALKHTKLSGRALATHLLSTSLLLGWVANELEESET